MIHFTREEFQHRQELTLAAMAARGLDGLVMFNRMPGS